MPHYLICRGYRDSEAHEVDVMHASRPVLCPTDFSNASQPAFTSAMTLVKARRATLMILHVIVPIVPLVPEQFLDTATWARIDRKTRDWGYTQLGRLAARARRRGLRVTTVLCEGDPSRHIVATARGLRAGFVVLGTHGRRGISRFLMGSVTERVVALAPCPAARIVKVAASFRHDCLCRFAPTTPARRWKDEFKARYGSTSS